MELPLYLSGRPAGTLQVRRQGLYTLFTAQLPPRPGLTRLYLHGGGESRLLGLMEPAAGMLRLRRKLSRAAQPPRLDYASDSPEPLDAAPRPNSAPPAAAGPQSSAAPAPPPQTTALDRSKASSAPAAPGQRPPGPALPASGWRRVSGGYWHPQRRLLALPCALARPDPRLRRGRLDGREVLVFQW